jgi:hypothetical protein
VRPSCQAARALGVLVEAHRLPTPFSPERTLLGVHEQEVRAEVGQASWRRTPSGAGSAERAQGAPSVSRGESVPQRRVRGEAPCCPPAEHVRAPGRSPGHVGERALQRGPRRLLPGPGECGSGQPGPPAPGPRRARGRRAPAERSPGAREHGPAVLLPPCAEGRARRARRGRRSRSAPLRGRRRSCPTADAPPRRPPRAPRSPRGRGAGPGATRRSSRGPCRPRPPPRGRARRPPGRLGGRPARRPAGGAPRAAPPRRRA